MATPSNKTTSKTTNGDEAMTPAEVARVLGLTPDTVRHLANQGKIPCLVTETGRRFFIRRDVEAYKAKRAETKP